MYRMLIVVPLTALLLTACVVTPAHHDRHLVVAPALPVVVEIGPEPYYYYQGYHYHYYNDRWSYSNSRSGPWLDLPRTHYPKNVRHRDRDGRRDRDDDRRDRR